VKTFSSFSKALSQHKARKSLQLMLIYFAVHEELAVEIRIIRLKFVFFHSPSILHRFVEATTENSEIYL
jgi:hypothetical protein